MTSEPSALLEAYDAQLRHTAEVLTATDVTYDGPLVRDLQSDSTEVSRTILERSGLVRVTTTTPFVWQRDTRTADPAILLA